MLGASIVSRMARKRAPQRCSHASDIIEVRCTVRCTATCTHAEREKLRWVTRRAFVTVAD
jgi:hypothetical protein